MGLIRFAGSKVLMQCADDGMQYWSADVLSEFLDTVQ